MPAIVKAQTTRQAKAAYKARTLSDKEARQLQRAFELEERAQRARDSAKRRAEAAKKRAEKERPARESARLGSQRRTDKFGFVASQFHLGTFFGMPRMQSEIPGMGDTESGGKRAEAEAEPENENEFGSDDLDDDTLLEALDSPETAKKPVSFSDVTKKPNALSMPPSPRPAVLESRQPGVAVRTTRPAAVVMPSPSPPAVLNRHQANIALPTSRHSPLVAPRPPRPCVLEARQARAPVAVPKPSAVSMSASCRLAVPGCPQTAKAHASRSMAASRPRDMLMRPPSRPSAGITKDVPMFKPVVQEEIDSFWDELDSSTQVARDLDGAGLSLSGPRPDDVVEKKRADSFCSGDFDMTEEELAELNPPKPASLLAFQAPKPMPPPPIPTRAANKVQTRAPSRPQTAMMKPQSAIGGPFLPASSLYRSPDLGFTSTQLERFIDDDIELSQAALG